MGANRVETRERLIVLLHAMPPRNTVDIITNAHATQQSVSQCQATFETQEAFETSHRNKPEKQANASVLLSPQQIRERSSS